MRDPAMRLHITGFAMVPLPDSSCFAFPRGLMRQHPSSPQQLIAQAHDRLAQTYGEPEFRPRRDPVSQLVATILSQNTSDVNTARSFAALREAYPDWQAVMRAPTSELADVIRSGGLADQKAPRIQQALQRIYEAQGDFDLSWLAEVPVQDARAWLTSLEGVGNKTASIVLLFCFNRPAFPVDTHVRRVCTGLGLAPAGASADRVMQVLETHTPPEWFYPLHLNLIRHGRAVCKARKPRCDNCVLRDLCRHVAVSGGRGPTLRGNASAATA
ncbi:MAG: endonuclease III [Caldilineae bacterium]|nr:MAG: endonuclease III [Caldilineae bacterium]